MNRQTRGRTDRGANGLVYAGLIIFGGALIGTVWWAFAATEARQQLSTAMCKIFAIGDCDEIPSSADEEFEPDPCMVRENEEVAGSQVIIGIVFGEETSYITQEHADGTTHLTVMDTGKLEALLGPGVGVNVGKYLEFGADLIITPHLSVSNGSTWVFDSPEEAEEFRELVDEHEMFEQQLQSCPICGLWMDEPEELRDPDITRVSDKSGVTVSGYLGAGLGQRQDREGSEDSSVKGARKHWMNKRLQAEGAIGVSAVTSEETNELTNETTTTYQLGGTGHIGADYLVDNVKESGELSGAMAVTEDEDGNVTKVTLTRVSLGENGPEQVTNEIEVETEEERRIVDEWMGAFSDDEVLPLTWDDMAPTELPEDANEFEELLFDKGKTSRLSYNEDDDVENVMASAGFMLALGGGITWGEREQTIEEAEYLGAPDEDGTREYVDWEACQ